MDDTPGSWIDDLRIYDTVLTSSEVSNIYNNISICFHKDTLINTDQGECKIKDLTSKHTIDNSKVIFLIKSENCPNQLVLIKKNAFQVDMPNQEILCTKNHIININNKIQQISNFIDNKSIILVDNLDDVYNIIINNKKFINVNNVNMGVININNQELTKLKDYIEMLNKNENKDNNNDINNYNKKYLKFILNDDNDNKISNTINFDLEKYIKFNKNN